MSRIAFVFALVAATVVALPTQDSCKAVSVQQDFNLTKYVTAHKWYIHKQQTIKYLPANERYCVVATYDLKDPTHVKVHNYANINHTNGPVDDSDEHVKSLGGICGISKDSAEPSKLEVGPCDLSIVSRFAYGPYWVIAAGDLSCVASGCPQPAGDYDWAFVSGGQPTHASGSGCIPGTGVNNAGMWIFTKSNVRNESLIAKVMEIGTQQGFDMSVLKDVDQVGCKYAPATPEDAQAVQETQTDKCCVGACDKSKGLEKYWSIASGILGEKHCGEACMEPSQYNLYHFFEKNLTKSDSDYPCRDFGFTVYDSTPTHGFGPIKMTLDLYNKPK